MTIVYRAPTPAAPEPIDRPVHREQCPQGHSYIGPLVENEIRRDWILKHAKHWETEEDE